MSRKSWARKTINVVLIIETINKNLANSVQDKDFRAGQIRVAEDILHNTGNWQGFSYLLQHEVPAGHLPGIVVFGTIEATPPEVRFEAGKVDATRIKFYI